MFNREMELVVIGNTCFPVIKDFVLKFCQDYLFSHLHRREDYKIKSSYSFFAGAKKMYSALWDQKFIGSINQNTINKSPLQISFVYHLNRNCGIKLT